MRGIIDDLAALRCQPKAERVSAYNEIVRLTADALLHDLPPDPATRPQLLPCADVVANDYNPNRVASTELDLLEQSMTADGITMPVVVSPVGDGHVVVDGFHRRTVATQRLGREYIPCSIISAPLGDRMASTVRHNRARGKHQVDLQAALVVEMVKLGMSDDDVAKRLGMSVEEMLRLKQIVGAAKLIAGVEYSTTYGRDDEPPNLLGE